MLPRSHSLVNEKRCRETVVSVSLCGWSICDEVCDMLKFAIDVSVVDDILLKNVNGRIG